MPLGPYPLGNTVVTLTVDDIVTIGPDDVPAMCMATVTVVDVTAPQVNASLVPTGDGDDNGDDDEGLFTVIYSATDNCDADAALTCDARSRHRAARRSR